MKLALRYCGGFVVKTEGQTFPILSAPSARLMALLGSKPGHRWSRIDVAAALWPGEPFSVTGNRSRTTLVGLRRALPGPSCIESTKFTLEVLAFKFTTNLAAAERLFFEAKLAAKPEDRLQLLEKPLRIIAAPVLPEWDQPWGSAFWEPSDGHSGCPQWIRTTITWARTRRPAIRRAGSLNT